jgi:hypothetical protein
MIKILWRLLFIILFVVTPVAAIVYYIFTGKDLFEKFLKYFDAKSAELNKIN